MQSHPHPHDSFLEHLTIHRAQTHCTTVTPKVTPKVTADLLWFPWLDTPPGVQQVWTSNMGC
jgi:hypothetical protein